MADAFSSSSDDGVPLTKLEIAMVSCCRVAAGGKVDLPSSRSHPPPIPSIRLGICVFHIHRHVTPDIYPYRPCTLHTQADLTLPFPQRVTLFPPSPLHPQHLTCFSYTPQSQTNARCPPSHILLINALFPARPPQLRSAPASPVLASGPHVRARPYSTPSHIPLISYCHFSSLPSPPPPPPALHHTCYLRPSPTPTFGSPTSHSYNTRLQAKVSEAAVCAMAVIFLKGEWGEKQMRVRGRGWTHLGEAGPIWARLDPSGRGWTHLGEAGPIWARLDPSGRGWTHLGEAGPFWARLDPSGRGWTARCPLRLDAQKEEVRFHVCAMSAANPYQVDTCLDDGAGGCNCLCPPGFVTGKQPDETPICVPGREATTVCALRGLWRTRDLMKPLSASQVGIAHDTLCATPYTVTADDTCESIAAAFSMTRSQFLKLNDDHLPCGRLKAGQQAAWVRVRVIKACVRAWVIKACVRAWVIKACVRAWVIKACVRAWVIKACVRAGVIKACVRAWVIKACVRAWVIKECVRAWVIKACVRAGVIKACVRAWVIRECVRAWVIKACARAWVIKECVRAWVIKACVRAWVIKECVRAWVIKACVRAWVIKACVRAWVIKECVRAWVIKACVRAWVIKACVRAWVIKACVRAWVIKACVRAWVIKACVRAWVICNQ
ncbi:unnamed protein product [Closterium sp. NIES-64]|nr:unnamed protein product [Closterium sp. NIES-64]